MDELFSKLDELVLLINKISNEKQKRLLLGKTAEVYGYGGLTRINNLIGISISALRKGREESNSEEHIDTKRVRKSGAGRKSLKELHPEIIDALEKIIDGQAYGDPSKEIHWIPTTLSLRKIEEKLLNDYGIECCYVVV